MTISRSLFVLGMLTILSATSLFGQTFGEVTGHISDPTGAAIPAARISLINTATNATTSASNRPTTPPTTASERFEPSSAAGALYCGYCPYWPGCPGCWP